MRKHCGWFVFALLLPTLVAQSSPGDSQKLVVIDHVTVIDATAAPARPDMTVVIVGDRITRLDQDGKAVAAKGVQVVDGEGKFLVPGMWDMHVRPTGKEYLT